MSMIKSHLKFNIFTDLIDNGDKKHYNNYGKAVTTCPNTRISTK